MKQPTLVDPNVSLIKSICADVQDHVGGNKVAAHMAGVTPSVWSGYVNPLLTDITIPLHRAMRLQKRSKRDDFTQFVQGFDIERDPVAVDHFTLAAECLSNLAYINAHLAKAHADGEKTPREFFDLLGEIKHLVDSAHNLQVCISHEGPALVRDRT